MGRRRKSVGGYIQLHPSPGTTTRFDPRIADVIPDAPARDTVSQDFARAE
jgi:hypothetical protein